MRHRGHFEVRDPSRKRAQFAVDLGELGAQLNIELIELRCGCWINEPEVDELLGGVERHGGQRALGRNRALGP
eukprot:12411497-Alexandrium_andersonii.AAC.1